MGIVAQVFQKMTEQKALSPYEERRDPPELNGSTRGSRFPNRKSHLYLGGYGGDNAVDWAYDCVRLIAETASSAEFHFEREGKTLLRRGHEITDTEKQGTAPRDLVNLMEAPNPYTDYVEHLELTIIDLMFAGEFIWWKYGMEKTANGAPLAIYRLNPSKTDVIPGEGSTKISHYEYKVDGRSRPVKIPADQILHGKFPNPHDEYRGLSIIAGGPRVFDTELNMVESQAQFFEQGTKLTGVVSTDKRVPSDVFNLIQRQFAAMYSGARNAYKVAVLESGLDFKPIQPSAADAEYEKLSKLSRDRIAHMFRVPLPLLGNMENANYKMSEAQRVFDTKTMRPLLDKLERIITTGLTEHWGVEFKIDYEYVMPDEDRLNLAGTFAALPGVRVREVREKAGLGPLGDERDDMVLNLPTENGPMPNAPGEAGRPPRRENIPGFPSVNSRLPDQRAAKKALIGDELPDPLREARTPTVDLIAHQIQTQLATAAHVLEGQLADELRNAKASPTLSKIKRSKAWRTFRASVERILTDAAERASRAAVDQHRIIGLRPGEVDFTQIAADLVNRPEGIDGIVNNLKAEIAKRVGEGLNRNLPIQEIIDGSSSFTGIRDVIGAWRDPNQIDRIGITEAAEYYNEGVLRSAENTGYGHVMVLDGTEDDEDCREASGQVWTIEKARQNRTQHPRCRRSFIPVVVDVA